MKKVNAWQSMDGSLYATEAEAARADAKFDSWRRSERFMAEFPAYLVRPSHIPCSSKDEARAVVEFLAQDKAFLMYLLSLWDRPAKETPERPDEGQ